MPVKKRSRKSPKRVSGLRSTVSANIRAAMEERFTLLRDRVKALSRAAGVSRSTVQRAVALDPEYGASIDVIAAIAEALDVAPHELLLPSRKR